MPAKNKNFDDYEDDYSDADLVDIPLDLEIIKNNLPTYSTEKLCEMVVCDRYFGCYKEIAIMCMEELANRRVAGDAFDFETYIDTAFDDLPKLDFSIPDLGDVLRQVIGRKIGK